MKPRTYATLVAALFALDVSAADLGMDAPALKIKDWVQGQPVDLLAGKGKQITVVEFWATWCGPCRASIPHLSDLQARFKNKNVAIVGISDEPLAKVKPFVDKMGDKMQYVVATDDARKTSTAYMEAFGERGIPHAFVVDKQGRIAFLPDAAAQWQIKAISEDGHGLDFKLTTDAAAALSGSEKPLFERYSRIFIGVAFILGLFGALSLYLKRKRAT